MSDIDPGLDSLHLGDEAAPPVPVREGLPPKFRMRADAHYVEQLDSSLFSSPVRFLEVRSIDPLQRDGDASLSTGFIESVRRHGILQPLLVRSRGGRFQVIAGSRRLAAAVEVGLREVPCLVERVEDDQARVLLAASNVPAAPREAVHDRRPEKSRVDSSFGAFAECLTAVASSAGLLSRGTTLTQGAAVDLVRAEVSRALQLLLAMRVLRGEVGPRRRSVLPRAVLQRVVDQTEPERRLRGLTLTVGQDQAEGLTLVGDEELLAASVSGLVAAAAALLEAPGTRNVTLDVTVRADGTVAFVAEHDGAELSLFWRSTLADDESRETALPGGAGVASALTMLRAARVVAELHGGRMTVECADGSTILSIEIPPGRP